VTTRSVSCRVHISRGGIYVCVLLVCQETSFSQLNGWFVHTQAVTAAAAAATEVAANTRFASIFLRPECFFHSLIPS